MNHYAVEMHFNLDTEAQIYDVWQTMKAAQISSRMVDGLFRPHMSLAVCSDLNLETFRPVLEQFASQTSPFDVWLNGVGLFLSDQAVIYIGVTMTQSLIMLHQQFQDVFLQHAAGQNPYYNVGQWVPHVTLAVDVAKENLPHAMTVLNESIDPLVNRHIMIGDVGVVNINNGESYYQFPLRGQ